MAKVSIIGSGFAGLSAACFMAQNGHEVSLFEKNETIGGRARVFEANGFLFDMGPSWYWMPDVFEQFFKQFGKGVNECYALVRLDPGFQMIFANNETVAIPASLEAIYELFEGLEKGSSAKLKLFLAEAKLKYAIGMGDIIRRPFISWSDFLNKDVVFNAPKLQLLSSHSKHVRKYFKDERIIALMEFPVLFLGAMSQNLPALYSLMNYAAIEGGTWYPMGGMYKIVEAMKELAVSLNVKINTGEAITLINVEHGSVKQLVTTKNVVETDAIIATGDYHHIEEQLLKEEYRNYNETYWQSRTFAPSCLIFYLGVRKRVKKLIHHNLFFDKNINTHAGEIYTHPQWPTEPLFYVCCPTKTDPSTAPPDCENLFILMPIAPGLEDTEALREKYYKHIMQRLEMYCEDQIDDFIVYKKSYCVTDFINDYNAYKGNAYGLANTLNQTATLKPTMKNRKVKNMFYAGQLTVPGPGVPPSLISGEIAARLLMKQISTAK